MNAPSMNMFNQGGHDWGTYNLDGYGIGFIVFALLWSIAIFFGAHYIHVNRHVPVMRIRNVSLMLASLTLLHLYITAVFIVYPLNGAFPCQAEFWIMSLYLPIGIGLFQAQNQQLLIVTEQQQEFMENKQVPSRPLLGNKAYGVGGLHYWSYRVKYWWGQSGKAKKYEVYVLFGVAVQLCVSLVLFLISRRLHPSYGLIGHEVSPGMCRRGWEWIPSIFWQCLWNFFFGPYLLLKVHKIHDAYQWRLQTMLCIIAGLPGTPLWIAGVYSDAFALVNRYWVPAMWLVPGIMIMEISTLVFPIITIRANKKMTAETKAILAEFDNKRLAAKSAPFTSTSSSVTSGAPSTLAPSSIAPSTKTNSTSTSRGKMYTMDSLETCLTHSIEGLQTYACLIEMNGENIFFLRQVIEFKTRWSSVWGQKNQIAPVAKKIMFRHALAIYIHLINSKTAAYPINVEGTIASMLEEMFHEATLLVASPGRKSSVSSTSSANSAVTPWEDSSLLEKDTLSTTSTATTLTPMRVQNPTHRSISFHDLEPMSPHNKSQGSVTTTRIDNNPFNLPSPPTGQILSTVTEVDPKALGEEYKGLMEGYTVPDEFNAHVFDEAFKSVKYMVWCETWQHYCKWSGVA